MSAIMEKYEKIGIMIEKGFSLEAILDLGYTEDEYFEARNQKNK